MTFAAYLDLTADVPFLPILLVALVVVIAVLFFWPKKDRKP